MNIPAVLPHLEKCEAPSQSRSCDPPCLSMRNNAPVEHCAAEASTFHRKVIAQDEGEHDFAHESYDYNREY